MIRKSYVLLILSLVAVLGCSNNVESIKLKSGASIHAFQDNSTPLVHLYIYIKSAGSLNDPIGKEGLADITAELMMNGTKSLPKEVYQATLDRIGSELTVNADYNGITISGVFLKEKALEYLTIIKSILTEPVFDKKQLEIEIERRKNFITTALKNDMFLLDYFYTKIWFKNHPYGRSEFGTYKSISNITIDDVASFFSTYVSSNTLVAGISGDLSDGSAIETLKKIIESMNNTKAAIPNVGEVPTQQGRKLFIIDKPNRNENNMYVVFNTKNINYASPDYIKIGLANNYFGGEEMDSLLIKEVRVNKGFVYFISSELDLNNVGGPLFISANLQNDKLIPSIHLILDLYHSFVSKGLSQLDLNIEKTSLINKFQFKQEITHTYMEDYIKQRVHNVPQNFNDNFVNNIKNIKLTDLNSAIVQHFDNNPKNYYVFLVSTANQIHNKLQQDGLFDSVEVIQYDSLLKE